MIFTLQQFYEQELLKCAVSNLSATNSDHIYVQITLSCLKEIFTANNIKLGKVMMETIRFMHIWLNHCDKDNNLERILVNMKNITYHFLYGQWLN